MGVKVTGLREFAEFTGDFPRGLERTVASVLKQEARALCVEMGAGTLPGPGFGETNAEGFRLRVEREVKRVFLTVEDKARIAALVGRRSPKLGKALRRVMKENPAGWIRDPQAIRYLREAGVKAEVLNPAQHKVARTGRQGRVPGNFRSDTVVSPAQRRAFVRKQQQLVGLAKAAWYVAAKALGGRVRLNLRDADGGNRRTVEQFSPYIRKLARRFPGIGGAEVSATRVSVFSNVSYASEAIPQEFHDRAVYGAQDRLRESLLRGIREARRRRGFRVAA